MIGRESFYNFRAGISHCIHFGKGICTGLFQHGNKLHEYLCSGLGVVHSPVVIFERYSQGFGYRIQGMFGLMRKKDSGNPQGIRTGKPPAKSLPQNVFFDKTHIKACIVSHQYRILTKRQKLGQYLFYVRRILHHTVIDACEFFDLKGNGHVGIDKGREFFCNLALLHLHRANLDDSVIYRGKTRRLYIKNHKIRAEILARFPHHQFLQIIHQIGFHSIDNLEEILLVRRRLPGLLTSSLLRLPQILPHMVCIGKGLYHSVIRDCNGRMSPPISALYKILCLRDAVHIAHLGVAVKLHSFFQAVVLTGGGKIRYLFHSNDRTYGEFIVKFVNRGDSFEFDKGALFYPLRHLRHLLIVDKNFDGYGIRKVRHIKHQDGLLVSDLPGIKADDLAPDDHLSHFSLYIFYGDGFLLKISSVNHIRMIGTL